MGAEIQYIHGGILGWRRFAASEGDKEEDPKKKEKREPGAIFAFRKNGDEALFGSAEETPMVWIPIGDFIFDPVQFEGDDDGEGDDVGPEEGDSQEDAAEGGPKGPFPAVRRRGAE